MTKQFKQIAASLLLMLAVCGVAKAETFSAVAELFVRNALSIEEIRGLNFGTIEKPSSTVTATVAFNGSTSGSATFIDDSDASEGRYRIRGSSLETINVTASNIGNVSGINFTDIEGKYKGNTGDLMSGMSGLAAPKANGTVLEIGATLTVDSSVSAGDHQAGFIIEVNYD